MAESGRTPKIAMLLKLLSAIDEGRHGLESLKVRLDAESPPSTRSVRRYLATLTQAGFPWFYDRASGTYRFDESYTLRKLELSGNELFGLLALKGIAHSLGGSLGASMDDVAAKLARVASGGAANVDARSAVRVQLADPRLEGERSETFEVLRRAQRDRQSVRFTYLDKNDRRSSRHADVYGFVVSSGRIYAIAHDRGRGAVRSFAVDGMTEPRIAPQRYSIPADFDIEAFSGASVSGIMHSGAPERVTVRFDALVARAAREDRVVANRTIAEVAGGGVEITYLVDDVAELVRWAMKWGAEAEIAGPPAARAMAADLARAVAARYAGG